MKKVGRKKIDGGVRRMWTVPPDIDVIIQKRGTKWLWTVVRAIEAYESRSVVNSDDTENILIRE